MGIAKNIIEEGLFNDSLPKLFDSKSLAENMENIDVSSEKLGKKLNKWCKLIEFSIPKNDQFRRVLSVPHPLPTFCLALLFEDKWEEIDAHFQKSNVSLTKLKEENGNLMRLNTFGDMKYIRIKYMSTNRYILSVDINRYYPSIYTHAIPWALHTKKQAKLHMRDGNLLGNQIDTLFRNMQDGQTVGIPIGPITSAIAQEIIGSTIDYEFKEKMKYDVPGLRYTDDMEYYFNDFESANRALSTITSILRFYHLDTNVEKTEIMKLPQRFDNEWITYFKEFTFKKSDGKRRTKIEENQLLKFFDKLFAYQREYNDKGIGKYAIKIVRNQVIYKENWNLYQSLLLQTGLNDSTILPIIYKIIEAYQFKGYSVDNQELTEYVQSVLKENILLNHDYEILWTLDFSRNCGIHINDELTEMLCNYEHPLINLNVIILHQKGLLGDVNNFEVYKTFIENDDLFDENWILLYECCKRGWLNKNSDIINEDEFFNQLITNDVSFINIDSTEIENTVIKSICTLYTKKYRRVDSSDFEKLLEQYGIELNKGMKSRILDMLSGDDASSEAESIVIEPGSSKEKKTESTVIEPDSSKEKKTESTVIEPDSSKEKKTESIVIEPDSSKKKKTESIVIEPDPSKKKKTESTVIEPDSSKEKKTKSIVIEPDSSKKKKTESIVIENNTSEVRDNRLWFKEFLLATSGQKNILHSITEEYE